MKKKFFLILLVLAVLTGCTKTDTQSTSKSSDQTSSNYNPEYGGTLNLSMRPTNTLNPLLVEDDSVSEILKLVFEPLIKIDEQNVPMPSIAESWAFSEDGLSITIKLKSNFKWHNGNPVTADDVIFSIETINSAPANSVYKPVSNKVSGCQKIDASTVVLTFNSPSYSNLYYLSFPVISKEYYGSENVLTSEKNCAPLGNGLFSFESFVQGSSLMLSAADTNFDMPFISKIKVSIFNDKETELYAFDNGIIDIICSSDTDFSAYNIKQYSQKFSYITNEIDLILFNFNNAVLTDKIIRQAIAYSIPLDNIIENTYLSSAQKAYTLIFPDSWLYESNAAVYDYNIQHAKELLDGNGWNELNENGIRIKSNENSSDTLSLRILVNSESKERTQSAYRLAGELRSIGFDIAIESVGFNEYKSKLASGDFDIAFCGFSLSQNPDLSFMLHSRGSQNYGNYSSETLDELLTNANSTTNEQEYQKYLSEIQKYICEEIPVLSLVYKKTNCYTNSNISGSLYPYRETSYNGIESIYLNNIN